MLSYQFECAESRGDIRFSWKRKNRAHTPPLRLVPVVSNTGNNGEYDGARVTMDFVLEEGERVRGESIVEEEEGEKRV